MNLDSRANTLEKDIPRYITSESGQSAWGQPAASSYVFAILDEVLYGQPIAGIYFPVRPSAIEYNDSNLTAEFEAWDTASDEALQYFEEELD
jgi:hypothetical protein